MLMAQTTTVSNSSCHELQLLIYLCACFIIKKQNYIQNTVNVSNFCCTPYLACGFAKTFDQILSDHSFESSEHKLHLLFWVYKSFSYKKLKKREKRKG